MSRQLNVLRALAAALAVVAGAAQAEALASGQAERAPSKANATTAAVVAVAGMVSPGSQVTATEAQDTVAGSDLALLLGGLGAIGFVTMRRGREDA